VIEAHRFGSRRSDFFASGKLAPGNLRLFQQHRPEAVLACAVQPVIQLHYG
jgi:hypothetical protein